MSVPAELWSKLAVAGLVAGDMPAAEETRTPWYVRVMLGAAGVIAAVFLLAFVGAGLSFVIESEVASIVAGLLLIAAAFGLFTMGSRSDFVTMFALAVSFAGQALLAFGIFMMFEDQQQTTLPFAILAVVEAVLALVVPNFIHRVTTAYLATVAFALACAQAGAWYLPAGVVGAAVAVAWLSEGRLAKMHSVVAPAGYGLTLAFMQIESSALSGYWIGTQSGAREMADVSPWIGEALVASALVATVWALIQRAGWKPTSARTLFALGVVVALGATSFKAPGIAGGLMIVLLGFANGNRVLTGLGIAALLYYVSAYYYLLAETLLFKSGVLLATGIVLLAARWLVLNVVIKERADA
jgi:uncharacterized membrane protein